MLEVQKVRRPWCLDREKRRGDVSARRDRLLVLVNIALIPYVAWRFPHEARAYAKGCLLTLWDGKRR
jgi:hypothetical protein